MPRSTCIHTLICFSSDVEFLLQSMGRRQKMRANSPSNAHASQKTTGRAGSAADTVALMRQVLNLQDECDFSIVLAQAEKLKPGIIEWVTVYLQPRPVV